MIGFEQIWEFEKLYKAYTVARRGKRDTREVIEFEMNLGEHLTQLSDDLLNGAYKIRGYYSFMVYDPKRRKIHALHYPDRVVQHCLCDNYLAPLLDKHLIYDNAACRIGKGTHFAMARLTEFLRKYYKNNCVNKKVSGYFLKCDIRKYFDNIDHEVLKNKLSRVITDRRVQCFLEAIIDSYQVSSNKGIPLGNQTSQWFALYYLDSFDRLIKEKLKIKYYTRYMDDCVLIHESKAYLKRCLEIMSKLLKEELKLEFNEKTQIFPIRNGVNYLGFHFYLTETGKVIRKVKQSTKIKYKRKLKYMMNAYENGTMSYADINQVVASYRAHLSFGHTYKLRKSVMHDFVLKTNLK